MSLIQVLGCPDPKVSDLPGLCALTQGGSMVKNPPANAGDIRDTGSIPGSGRSSGEGNGNALQYPCLENSVKRGSSWAAVDEVKKSQIQLSLHARTISWPCIKFQTAPNGVTSFPLVLCQPHCCSVPKH